MNSFVLEVKASDLFTIAFKYKAIADRCKNRKTKLRFYKKAVKEIKNIDEDKIRKSLCIANRED